MLALGLAAVLRVGWPTLAEFKFDEARMAALAMQLPQTGRMPLAGLPSSAGFEHSPISVYLYVPAFLFASNVIPAIVYGGLVNVAAVALCWWLAERSSGGRTGGWTSLIPVVLLAANPWAILFGRKIWQIAFVIPLTLAFVSLAVAALVPGAVPGDSKARDRRLSGAVVVLALLIQVHPSVILLLPAFLLWLLLFGHQVRLRPLLFGAGLGLATTLPFLVHQAQTGWPVLGAAQSLEQPRWDAASVRLAWEAITARGVPVLGGKAFPLLGVLDLIGWAVVAGVLWLGLRAFRDWRSVDPGRRLAARVDIIFLSWLLLPVLLSLRHRLDLSLHTFALVVPAGGLVLGRALAAQLNGREQRGGWLSARVVGVLGTGLVLLAAVQVLLVVRTGRAVASQHQSESFGMPLRRYLEISDQVLEQAAAIDAAEVLVIGQGDSIHVAETPAIFDVLLRGKVAYRFVDGGSAAVFPAGTALVLLTPGVQRAADWYRAWPAQPLGDEYDLVALDGSWPGAGLHPIPSPRLFRNGIEIQGYAWQVPDRVTDTAGRLWLLWQVLWLSSEDTHFTVRLMNQAGQVVGQEDHAGYPIAYRRKGDRILSAFDLLEEGSTTSGPFEASVGVYLYPEIDTLPVIDQDGHALAETVSFGLLNRER